MKKLDIAIIILHYVNMNDTIECVQSFIDNLDTHNYLLVVVDNASPDGSGKELDNLYVKHDRVKVILNSENLGFSAGNNIGIEYVKNNFAVDFIVLSNNDIVLKESSFYSKIKNEFKANSFAALGPLIMTADGAYTSNPIFDLPYTMQAAKCQKKEFEKRLKRLKNPLYPLNERVYGFFKKLGRRLKLYKSVDNGRKLPLSPFDANLKKRFSVVLHGSFLVFSPIYFEYFNGLDARTFLYAEEDILYQHLIDKNLVIEYDPEIVVYHKEGKSVQSSSKSTKSKKIFVTENCIKAINAYIIFLSELENNK